MPAGLTLGREAEGSKVPNHSWLYREFKACPRSIINEIFLQGKIREAKRRGRMGMYKLVGFGDKKLKDHLLYNNMNKR